MTAATLPALLQRFFTDRLCTQMEASRHTVAGYRDTFRLALALRERATRQAADQAQIEDIDADLIADFLVHGETARGNSARSRNTRLAAIRSFFRYVAMTDPAWLLHCQRILAMPNKRYVKRTVTFLDAKRSRRCSRHRIARHGQAGAITRCSCSRSRPACGHPSW